MKSTLLLISLLVIMPAGVFLFALYYFDGIRNSGVEKSVASNTIDNTLSQSNFSSLGIKDLVNNTNAVESVIKEQGVVFVMQKLIGESKGGSTFDCHQEAHIIGRTGYKVLGEKTFQACDASCHSGCYHGAMEKMLSQYGTANLAERIQHVCSLFDTSFGTFECLHGVGHGVLAYTDYDVPAALNECKGLLDAFSISSCYGGVFMENIITGQGLGTGNEDHTTTWVSKTDPLYPCNKIDTSHDVQFQCYQMQTSWMLTIFRQDYDKVVAECKKVPDAMIPVCFKSLGRDIAGNTLRKPAGIKELCAKVPEENGYYNQCIVGATNVIVDFWGPHLQDQATELCRLLDEPGKGTCYHVVSSRLSGLYKDESSKKQVCDLFEESYTSLCTPVS